MKQTLSPTFCLWQCPPNSRIKFSASETVAKREAILFLPSAAWRWIVQGQSALAIIDGVVHSHWCNSYFGNKQFVFTLKIYSKSNQLKIKGSYCVIQTNFFKLPKNIFIWLETNNQDTVLWYTWQSITKFKAFFRLISVWNSSWERWSIRLITKRGRTSAFRNLGAKGCFENSSLLETQVLVTDAHEQFKQFLLMTFSMKSRHDPTLHFLRAHYSKCLSTVLNILNKLFFVVSWRFNIYKSLTFTMCDTNIT